MINDLPGDIWQLNTKCELI